MKMKKVKLPVIQDEVTHWPSEPVCPVCQKRKIFEPHSFAMLGFGALRVDRKSNSGRPSPDLDAFFNLIWHGAHQEGEGVNREISCMVDIVKNIHGGEAELYFCSLACLRKFLNHCVDQLEQKMVRKSHCNKCIDSGGANDTAKRNK
jgi:hypothetical protein